MRAEKLTYDDGGLNFGGTLVFDDSAPGRRPGILVWPDAMGVTQNTLRRAEMLARLGYVALAADPYGGNAMAADFLEARELAEALLADRDGVRRRGRMTLERLVQSPHVDSQRLAVVGYCMGGTIALEMARNGEDLRGVVCFHGQLDTPSPASSGSVKAKILICNGSEDPVVPEAQVRAFCDEMRVAKSDWQINTYGNTYHSFTDWAADGSVFYASMYNEVSDRRSWDAMAYFLREVL